MRAWIEVLKRLPHEYLLAEQTGLQIWCEFAQPLTLPRTFTLTLTCPALWAENNAVECENCKLCKGYTHNIPSTRQWLGVRLLFTWLARDFRTKALSQDKLIQNNIFAGTTNPQTHRRLYEREKMKERRSEALTITRLLWIGNNEIADNWARHSRHYLRLLTIMNNNWLTFRRSLIRSRPVHNPTTVCENLCLVLISVV